MLFLWDVIHGWRYHDLRLMPFPSPSFSNPEELLASSSACGAGSPRRSSSVDLVAEADHINSGDDDSYWDAYGTAGHDLASPLPPQNSSDAVEGEDAYWAQYASVQGYYFRPNASCGISQPNSSMSLGSADSTVPSPLPTHRKLRLVNPESAFPFPPQDDSIIDIPVDAIRSRPLPSRIEPPSPNMLAHLLSTISPRKEISSSVLDDSYSLRSPSAYGTDPSAEETSTAANSELVTPPLPNGYLDASFVSPVAVKLNGVPLLKSRSRPDQAEDMALTDSIKGLYYLWKAARKGEPDETERSVFLEIVRAAIAHE